MLSSIPKLPVIVRLCMEYLFIAITLRSTLTRGGSTYQSLIAITPRSTLTRGGRTYQSLIAITLRSTLTRGSSTYESLIYVSNRSVYKMSVLNRNI